MITGNRNPPSGSEATMTLDDLRAQAHALNLKLSEAANLADDLAVALQNYTPDPPAPPPAPVVLAGYARLIYTVPSVDGRWGLQVLQGQPDVVSRMPDLRKAGAKRLLRYTSPLTRVAGDTIRQAYGTWSDAWFALDKTGKAIASTKFGGGQNLLIDVGKVDYQNESAQYLVRKCRTEGWNGIYLDEINEQLSYAGYAIPAAYGTDTAFQIAQLDYVTYVAAALRDAGYSCHINLGSNYTQWAKEITLACSGQHIEYWIAQRSMGRLASLENAEWMRQLNWLTWNEQQKRESICQADARTAGEVVYALASYLLATTGYAKFAAMNATQYGAGGAWWVSEMDVALHLGAPLGTWSLANGLYSRKFERGVVTVNPTQKPINTMPATSGLIELR
jgi:hypothetical protein